MEEYKNKDIHVGFGRRDCPTKFNELSEPELRNYVKYDLNNLADFSNFYEQINQIDEYGRIASSLV